MIGNTIDKTLSADPSLSSCLGDSNCGNSCKRLCDYVCKLCASVYVYQ